MEMTKSELKQLVGASGTSDGCTEYVDEENKIRRCMGGPCLTSCLGQSGYCRWNPGTYNCECLVGTFYSY